ncbi:MATE family efflux transporter [Bacillus alkalicellulosilyticus]|uniref:MATE family efflux transporter n=1 Tax=Alkalihalobacterium alkalicellulosilyticum TaxID=1912214 RepID=UPI0009978488|nr:MATE family efflux transporter [Bacillus alkalicellulosilyticus]
MSEKKQIDFTTGRISRKMLLFSWPIFFANLLQTSYQFIDSLWVGNLLGAGALGAISISATVIFTILSFIIGVNGASLTILSQYRGAKDEEGLKKALNAFVFVLGTMTLVLSLVGFLFAGPILSFLGTPDSIYPVALSYLQINFIGILFLFGYNFIGTVLRAMGDSKTPVRFVLIAVILNTVLDPLFIAGFNMGIEGAALATIVSQGIAFIYGLWFSIRKADVPFSKPQLPSKLQFIQLFKLGLPSGLSMMAISGGVMAIMGVVATFGEEVVAGFGAAQRIDSLIMLPAMTLGSAVNSMAGQNIGANQWRRVSEITKNGIYLILSVTLLISTIAFIWSRFFISLFIDDPETIEFGASYLRTVAFFYPFLGINFVLNGIVRAAGAMVPVLVLNIISFWLLRYPLTYLFAKWYGEQGIALGMGVSFIISSFIASGYYLFGKWRKKVVINEKS